MLSDRSRSTTIASFAWRFVITLPLIAAFWIFILQPLYARPIARIATGTIRALESPRVTGDVVVHGSTARIHGERVAASAGPWDLDMRRQHMDVPVFLTLLLLTPGIFSRRFFRALLGGSLILAAGHVAFFALDLHAAYAESAIGLYAGQEAHPDNTEFWQSLDAPHAAATAIAGKARNVYAAVVAPVIPIFAWASTCHGLLAGLLVSPAVPLAGPGGPVQRRRRPRPVGSGPSSEFIRRPRRRKKVRRVPNPHEADGDRGD